MRPLNALLAISNQLNNTVDILMASFKNPQKPQAFHEVAEIALEHVLNVPTPQLGLHHVWS